MPATLCTIWRALLAMWRKDALLVGAMKGDVRAYHLTTSIGLVHGSASLTRAAHRGHALRAMEPSGLQLIGYVGADKATMPLNRTALLARNRNVRRAGYGRRTDRSTDLLFTGASQLSHETKRDALTKTETSDSASKNWPRQVGLLCSFRKAPVQPVLGVRAIRKPRESRNSGRSGTPPEFRTD
jgi:hypothetical protein